MKEYSIHCYNKLKLNMSKIILLLSYFFICAISREIGTEGSIQCGVENMGTDRISGGMETAPNQFPWMVRVLAHGMGCGGSLITDTHILTARHCVAGGEWQGEMVKISVHDQTDPHDYEEVPIKDCVWPDTEDSDITNGDIAIVILERPVNLNDNTIGTVCLPASPHEDYRGKKGLALGWGWNPVADGQSAKLRMVDLTVTDWVQDGYPEDFWLFTKVVFNDDGVPLDACGGDSGGPLVYKEGGRWTIIGIVSAGESCADHHGHDSFWAKVTGHLEWIEKVIGM